jgi:hypothetical protein
VGCPRFTQLQQQRKQRNKFPASGFIERDVFGGSHRSRVRGITMRQMISCANQGSVSQFRCRRCHVVCGFSLYSNQSCPMLPSNCKRLCRAQVRMTCSNSAGSAGFNRRAGVGARFMMPSKITRYSHQKKAPLRSPFRIRRLRTRMSPYERPVPWSATAPATGKRPCQLWNPH